MITKPKEYKIRFLFKEILFHHTIRVVDDRLNLMDGYKQLDYRPMFDNLKSIDQFSFSLMSKFYLLVDRVSQHFERNPNKLLFEQDQFVFRTTKHLIYV
jgi:hypothetical protein